MRFKTCPLWWMVKQCTSSAKCDHHSQLSSITAVHLTFVTVFYNYVRGVPGNGLPTDERHIFGIGVLQGEGLQLPGNDNIRTITSLNTLMLEKYSTSNVWLLSVMFSFWFVFKICPLQEKSFESLLFIFIHYL